MVIKGDQYNLDQSEDILDIKDRNILSPQLSSFWLSRHCLLQSRYLRTTLIATAIESNTKVCTMFGGRRGGWTLRRVGWGLGQRRLCLLFWCCYLLKLLQLQQQCRAISNWWLQSISNKIFKKAFLLLHRVSLLTMDNLSKVVRDRNQRGDKSKNLHQISNSFPVSNRNRLKWQNHKLWMKTTLFICTMFVGKKF